LSSGIIQDSNATYITELIKADMTRKIVDDAIERARPELVRMAKELLQELKPSIETFVSHEHQALIVNLVVRDPTKK
jgi:hypothetical protein